MVTRTVTILSLCPPSLKHPGLVSAMMKEFSAFVAKETSDPMTVTEDVSSMMNVMFSELDEEFNAHFFTIKIPQVPLPTFPVSTNSEPFNYDRRFFTCEVQRYFGYPPISVIGFLSLDFHT